MNGDQTSNEILRAVGGLESTVKILIDRFDENQEDLKTMKVSCQRFEDLNIASRIAEFEKVKQDYLDSKTTRDEKYRRIDFLYEKWKAALVTAGAITLLANLLLFALQFGWIRWNL